VEWEINVSQQQKGKRGRERIWRKNENKSNPIDWLVDKEFNLISILQVNVLYIHYVHYVQKIAFIFHFPKGFIVYVHTIVKKGKSTEKRSKEG
jgi:hypothetical protein